MKCFAPAIAAAVLLWVSPLAVASAVDDVQVPDLQIYVSAHYEIHTNLSRMETIPFGRHMDAVFERYQSRFSRFVKRSAGPMPLYLFRTQAQYLAFMRHHELEADHSGGMFFVKHGLQGLATWAEGHSRSRTFRVLQHEGFHQFAWAYIGPSLPVWINEGLAQYFEDAVLLDHGMQLGLADPRRLQTIQHAIDHTLTVPTDSLLSLTDRQWSGVLAADATRGNLLYAQSWSIVYFLIHGDGGRYQGAFETYLRLVSNGEPSERAFRAAFGSNDTRGLDRRWKHFALRQSADPVTAATERLDFLGTALAFMADRDEPLPDRLDNLRDNLQARKFTVTRTAHGIKSELQATDASLFTYDHPNGYAVDFLLLEPSGRNLPPRVTAPGLDPEPTLVWTRSRDGELIYDVEFR